ncbi:hypothetical protein OAM19_01200 [bacterium]|nr:hypothetical protein [bacterium]
MKKIFFKFFLLFSTLLSLGFAAESKNQELRIGAILPLTGDYQEIGNNVLKTFELTLFELPNVNVVLIPFDNQSSPSGTKFAFQELQSQKIDIILGPIFEENLQSIINVNNFSKYTFVSLSNNILNLPENVISFGINVNSQILALKKKLSEKKKDTIFFGDEKNFSQTVLGGMELQQIKFRNKYRYQSFKEISPKARDATSYDWRHKKLLDQIKILQSSEELKDIKRLKILEQLDTLGGVSYEQVFIPAFDNELISVVSFFDYYDVNYNNVEFVTLNQWFNKTILIEPSLQNIIFPSINYKNFQELNTKFKDNYNKEISNIEIIAYDTIPLLVSIWNEKKDKIFTIQDFRNKEFRGKVGIFKINQYNFAEHKLDLYQVKKGTFKKIN